MGVFFIPMTGAMMKAAAAGPRPATAPQPAITEVKTTRMKTFSPLPLYAGV